MRRARKLSRALVLLPHYVCNYFSTLHLIPPFHQLFLHSPLHACMLYIFIKPIPLFLHPSFHPIYFILQACSSPYVHHQPWATMCSSTIVVIYKAWFYSPVNKVAFPHLLFILPILYIHEHEHEHYFFYSSTYITPNLLIGAEYWAQARLLCWPDHTSSFGGR